MILVKLIAARINNKILSDFVINEGANKDPLQEIMQVITMLFKAKKANSVNGAVNEQQQPEERQKQGSYSLNKVTVPCASNFSSEPANLYLKMKK